MASHVEKNRRDWDLSSDAYQASHGEELERTALAWGVWRVPESELRVLGDLTPGSEVLELGCGAAQWTLALLEAGVHASGIDLSIGQLSHARRAAAARGLAPWLTLGDAEQLPFADACFDIVFCDHGATSFTQPARSLPEAARVLRPGGLLAFCMSSPLRDLCVDDASDEVGNALRHDYFGMHALPDDDGICFQLPYGEWIRLFRRCGLEVEDLIEIQAPEGATTPYEGYVSPEWARRWPAENIWKLRKRPDTRKDS